MRKACDDCTCGAAEGKEPIKLTQEMLDNPVTACGSVCRGVIGENVRENDGVVV